MATIDFGSTILLLFIINVINSARILVIVPSPSISHNLFFHPIIEELSSRGHQVISIAGVSIDNPNLTNLTEINIRKAIYGIFNAENFLLHVQFKQPRTGEAMQRICSTISPRADAILSDDNVKKVLENEKFDLILIEQFLLYGAFSHLKHHFKCPMIGISSAGLGLHNFDAIGNPSFPSYYVDYWRPSGSGLSFIERFDNFIHAIESRFAYLKYCRGAQQKIVEKHFGSGVNLDKSESEVDLMLINENPIFGPAYPLMPSVIQIGGLHERKLAPLPHDLQQYLDSAKEGVIYFSFGSNVKSASMPPETLKTILSAFKKLPYQVLWKWESENLEGKPENVKVRKWLPQPDVLEHPNVKGFVTQGGIQSIEEAIRSKVPMLCIPFGGDQEFNARRIQDRLIGRYLPFHQMTADTLAEGMKAIVENPLYQSKVEKMSELLWDQPTKPLDRAIWWIEYVLRHKGAGHLRSPAADMSWFKLLSLDVISFLLGCFIVTLTLIYYLCKFLLRLILSKPKKLKTK